MKLQVLVSTMSQRDYSLLEKMNIDSDAIVINQCHEISDNEIQYNGWKVKWINDLERGLSKSRNLALKYATGDVCVLADDDLEYVENYRDLIIEQFKLHPEADIIVFQVEGIEKKFKNYSKKPKKLNYITSMKVSSVEVAFRLEKIKKFDIKFDENFGAGAKYKMGEENIFLTYCIKNGLKVIFVPVKIADLHIGESSWFKGFNKDYFISKGAMFTAINIQFSLPLIFQFALRKHKIYKKEMNLISALKLMLIGRRQYLNLNYSLNKNNKLIKSNKI